MDSRLDLQPLWRLEPPRPDGATALEAPWGALHRPDWAGRGMVVWPRGGQEIRLRLRLERPAAWVGLGAERAVARLCLRWWAEEAALHVDGLCVQRGDLFDTACRWALPERWWRGEVLELDLRLRSPRHDDGALMHSRLELEPRDPSDPDGLLAATAASLAALRTARGRSPEAGPGAVQVLGHAHLDLAWLWPVADTWAAAERTFSSALDLMERWPELHFGHSTPALYAWLERQRPALFARIRRAMRSGRWEPLNGPWVESDCVLIDTASLLRQFQLGQLYSRGAFPEWRHELAWLPDSFGFGAGLPAVAQATAVRWFCTHKLAWNATNPFPHRLFRWRSRCGGEVLALMTAPIGSDGDPVAIETHRLAWQAGSGVAESLWLPGVGDHGGGPTAAMLEQLALWQRQPAMAPLRHGTLRDHLERLAPLAPRLPVWRDELYLELHRGCATSRPDQKRHNRTLERLLREAELARALLLASGDRDRGPGESAAAGERGQAGPRGEAPSPAPRNDGPGITAPGITTPDGGDDGPIDWRPLLFQQFHDILPGTSIPEVFEQAEPEWRRARRRTSRQRDRALQRLLATAGATPGGGPAPSPGAKAPLAVWEPWWAAQLQPLPSCHRCVRLPAGQWRLAGAGPQTPQALEGQPASEGGVWLQLPMAGGVSALALERRRGDGAWGESARGAADGAAAGGSCGPPLPIRHPVRLERRTGGGGWRLDNGLLSAHCGAAGVEQLCDGAGRALLAAPLRWCRWRDQGEYWDAWDIAADHRDHPLPWSWDPAPTLRARGPLCGELLWRGRCGASPVRLTVRLLAGSPWLELVLSVQWQQRHELLQLEIPQARAQPRWAADSGAAVLERPTRPRTERERARWEVPAISWVAAGDVAVLLDGPQGVSAGPQHLAISLLRGPTWPDPGADNGWHRLRLAVMAAPDGWREAQVPRQARRLREPLWLRPAHPGAQDPLQAVSAASVGSSEGGVPSGQGRGDGWIGLPPLAPDLRLVSLRSAPDRTRGPSEGTSLILTLQNEGPCRRRLDLPAAWRVLERLDGLDQPLEPAPPEPLSLGPWQLGCWRIQGPEGD